MRQIFRLFTKALSLIWPYSIRWLRDHVSGELKRNYGCFKAVLNHLPEGSMGNYKHPSQDSECLGQDSEL